jgi:hypothetical protein
MVFSCKEKSVEPVPPTVDAVSVSEITTASVRLNSAISNSGNQEITDYGFVYSETNAAPTVNDLKTTHGMVDPKVPTPIDFSDIIPSLKATTSYYARAYAVIASGAVYGKVSTFQTSSVVQPKIKTDGASSITVNSAKLQGTIEAKGTNPISEYGICWSATSANPTTTDLKASKSGNVTTFPTTYSVDAGSLAINTTYNFRAYVISNGVTTYGNTLNFKTAGVVQPVIKTDGSNNITTNSAKLQGSISSKGTYDITEYGICWSATNANPTTADTKASKSGNITTFPTTYTVDAINLQPNTTYNFRAYVISNGVTSYGGALNFKTSSIVQPGIKTDGSNNITFNAAKLQGTVTSQGTFNVAEYGICWSSTNASPTTNDSKASKSGNITNFPSTYTVDATNLQPNTTYNFRAYVISNGVVSYGNALTFKTLAVTQPSVTTGGASGITVNSAKLQGNITALGSYPISEYGICWSTNNQNPSVADTKSSKSGNVSSVPNAFTVDATNLSAITLYYYRAYVISNGVITYGNAMSFRTLPVTLPTVTTGDYVIQNSSAVTLKGTVNTKGSYDISEYGICWSSTSRTPTVSDAKSFKSGNPASFPASYSVEATNLNNAVTYYYRAYVIANGVVTYGNVLNFYIGKI